MSRKPPHGGNAWDTKVDLIFDASGECWVRRAAQPRAERAPWLDAYETHSLHPSGRQALIRRRGGGELLGQVLVADLPAERVELLIDWWPQQILITAAYDHAGQQVAVLGVRGFGRDGQPEVVLSTLDRSGGSVREVWSAPGELSIGSRLAWSPDGTQLAANVLGQDPDDLHEDAADFVVIIHLASGTEVFRVLGYNLWSGPGDAWDDNGILHLRSYFPPEDPPRNAGAPTAVMRFPYREDPGPWPRRLWNPAETPWQHFEGLSDDPGELRWLKIDGTLGDLICEIPQLVDVTSTRGLSASSTTSDPRG
jgi:hypothetical protein